jgi:ADP-ribose pyrophosphatase YjhB (NUDIX family)
MQITYCYVIIQLLKDDKILLIKRAKTGIFENCFSLIGGHLDGNETAKQGAIREAYEEIDIIIEEQDLQFAGVIHEKGTKENTLAFLKKYNLPFKIDNLEFVCFNFVATKWQGVPINKEPDKHEYIEWFALDNLPTNLLLSSFRAIKLAREKQYYSEYGWDK